METGDHLKKTGRHRLAIRVGQQIKLIRMKNIILLATMLFAFEVANAQCTIWKSDRAVNKESRLYIIDGNTIWQSDRAGNKQSRLLILEGGYLMKTTVITCILGKL